MPYLVALVGLLILVLSALGMAAPERLAGMVAGWPTGTRVFVAAGTRLVVGGLFLLAASRCRFPTVIRAFGVLALTAAIALVLLGAGRVDAFIEWWTRQPGAFIRAWCVLASLMGGLIVYSALPDVDRR